MVFSKNPPFFIIGNITFWVCRREVGDITGVLEMFVIDEEILLYLCTSKRNDVTLDEKTIERIEKALASNKLDVRFVADFSDILNSCDEQDLENTVLYSARGKPNLNIEGLNYIAGEIYTGHTTYKRVLDIVELNEFYSFQKSRKLRPV